MNNVPQKIYLQISPDYIPKDDDSFTVFSTVNEIKWTDHRINPSDLEFAYCPPTVKASKGFIVFAVLIISITVAVVTYMIRHEVGYYIEQGVFVDRKGESSYPTFIWYNRDIIQSWFDPITISDSLKTARRMEAEKIVKTLKN